MFQPTQRGYGPSANAAAPMSAQETTNLKAVELRLGHLFTEPHLLLEALTHRSFAYEAVGMTVPHNERLEFLGDAVLGFIAADLAFAREPLADEGKLTTLRSALIRTTTLARFARGLGLDQALRVGRGHSARAMGDRVWASTFEAVVGALYVEGGLEAASAFLCPLLSAELESALSETRLKDDKTQLQDLAQAQLGITPQYRVATAEGPAHEPRFVVEVLLNDRVVGTGAGGNKRQAEQAAAKSALKDPGWHNATDDATERSRGPE